MSNAQHSWDVKKFPNKHKPACLNRHVSHYAASNTCSHRGQAYLRAKGDSKTYKWPKDVKGPPSAGAWDVTGAGNFQKYSTKPYWHEAHHLIPNSELRSAIIDASKGPLEGIMIRLIRGGLLDEKYNLNEKTNMIILPMSPKANKALKLPMHRRTPAHRSHRAYSKYVLGRVKNALAPMKSKAKKCTDKPPAYKKTKQKLVNISKSLYPQVKAAGAIKLDDLFK
jgi:hypothetical protein